MIIEYVERHNIDQYTCYDTKRKINMHRIFQNGSLLYGYIDSFNIVSIDMDMIISIDGKPGKYTERHSLK